MTEYNWFSDLADSMLPVEGYVAARELADNEDGIKAMTMMLDMLVEQGLAMAILTMLGDQKEWVYGRVHAKPV